MYVKCVILDGFKSYGSRATVGEFDPHFNAITGLNGSGKSNILDGIAFVLGISCINVVRAQNLNDLIFKGGSVKRASVSVVFDNKDKRRFKCPIGYERYDEIVVSRTVEEGSTCKYYLNSITSTKKTIQDMFESVQLNVNNPNFMIMQGKITKVVNMKPKEILNMIEDCVGGTVYEHKRTRCVIEVEAKQRHMGEIRDVLSNVIHPSMRRHAAAYELYQDFKDVEKARHKKAQAYAIASYGHHLGVIEEAEKEVAVFKDNDKDEESKIEEGNQQILDKQKRREEIKKESHKIATEKVAGIDKLVKEERKKVATQEVGFDAAVSAVKQSLVSVKTAKKALANEEKQVADYHQKSGNLINEFTAITAEIEKSKVAIAESKERESELNAGKVLGEDGKTFDLRERLVVVDDEVGKIRPQHDHEGRLLELEENKLKEMDLKLRKTPSDAQIEKDFRAAEQEVDKLERQMQSLNISPEQYATTENKHNTTSQRLNTLDAERRQSLNEFPYLGFEYTAPYPNFKHDSVHGAVYELFEMPDPGKYRNAFEVAIQGSLSVIVVDTDDTCRAIIKHGNVATRRSYMPLSKVRRNDRSTPTQAELDRKVGGPGKAIWAVNLIKYEDQYDLLMKSYLGRTVLCDTMETAKKVAYQMQYKAITIDGDVCDSDGGMQGGTRKNLGRLIMVSQKLRLINMERNDLIRNMRDLNTRMELYKKNASLLRKYDQATRHLKNATEERQCTAYAAILADVNALKDTINERKTKMEGWKKELTHWTKEQATLRKTLDSFEEVKTKNLKSARAEIVKWTKALESAQKKYDAKKATFGSVEMDLKAKEALLDDLKKDIEKEEKGLEDANAAVAEKQILLTEARTILQEKENERSEVVEEHRVWDEETSKLDSEITNIQKQIQKFELAKIKRDNTLQKAEERLESTRTTMDALVKKHPALKLKTHWNELEKPKQSVKKCREEWENLEKRYDELRQRVDPDVVERLQEGKEMEKSAATKLGILKGNKSDLEKSIELLDSQKANMVKRAYADVNTEFGKMMNTLLPEATAKLVPVTSVESLTDGVNIHVRLGGVWKESLTELSGGQRSLVALALVLSLCMYEPAPFYILDEIDAALDLNHTQNIGVLIKERFKDTQFICVSLKDGMYTNSNVLFTTQFQDGKSNVIRTAKGSDTSKQNTSNKYDHVGKQKVRATRKV